MWILESDADFLQGKRMWLKPGKKYLFGRVKRDGVRYALDHKTISRKHFIISVGHVKDGDAFHIHSRTKVSIADENSKAGTYLDGVLLRGGSRDLQDAEHSVRPGSFPNELVIKWVPCVLTFHLNKKEIQANAMKLKRERLEELDVKVSAEFINDQTTHVVASKRNLVKSLQALILGRYLVTDSFVEALIYAATPADLGEEENLSSLEQDFDKAWPKEEDYLPLAGKEPTAKPPATYGPDKNRSNIFENFIFVFLDKTQYDNLLPAITCGHGKALLFNIKSGETSVDELVQFMRSTAGEKEFGDAKESSINGGAIMIRSMGSEGHGEWMTNLINQVTLRLDQRAIQQAEFLEAILANDPFLLRQSVTFESTVEGRAAPPPTMASLSTILPSLSSPQRQTRGPGPQQDDRGGSPLQVPSFQKNPAGLGPPVSVPAVNEVSQRIPSSAPEPAADAQAVSQEQPLGKRPKFRMGPVSRFKDFDDGFDEDSIPSYTKDAFPEEFPSQDIANSSISDSRDQSADPSVKEEPTSTRKRRRSPTTSSVHSDGGGNKIEDLLPAATAMKRRKVAMETEAGEQGQPVFSVSKRLAPPQPATTKKKNPPKIDVREIAKAQRKAEEEAAKREKEDLAEGLGYENDEMGKPAGLVVVEEMEIPIRASTQPTRRQGEASDRWDPKWNGRKNFKRFRRSGTEKDGEMRKRPRGVIVPLVEIKMNTYGLGEQMWENGSNKRKKPGMSQSQSHGQSQASRTTQLTSQTFNGTSEDVVELSSDDDEEQARPTSTETARLQAEAASIVEHAIELDTPRRTRLADKTRASHARAGQKRAAIQPASSGGREKRQKTIPTIEDRGNDSDDSDELKFRFGRRKK